MKKDYASLKFSRFDVRWAALAWAQFLVIVTAVNKQDFNLSKAWEVFSKSWMESIFPPLGTFPDAPFTLFKDTSPFGSFALIFNVIALGMLTMPLAGIRSDIGATGKRKFRFHSKVLSDLGVLCWLASTLSFLIYLEPIAAAFAFVASAFSFIWIIVAMRKELKEFSDRIEAEKKKAGLQAR